MNMTEPLNPKVGAQIFKLDGVEVKGSMMIFPRKALETLWYGLHDLQQASAEIETKK